MFLLSEAAIDFCLFENCLFSLCEHKTMKMVFNNSGHVSGILAITLFIKPVPWGNHIQCTRRHHSINQNRI